MSSSPKAGVDFFRHGALQVPQVTTQEAERIAASFGLTVRAEPLGSQQDSNFLLADGNRVLGVLKIANPAFGAGEIEAQDRAAERVAGSGGLRAGTVLHGPVSVPVDGGPVDGGRSAWRCGRSSIPGSTGCCSGTCGTRCAWWTRWPGTCGTPGCGPG